MKQLPILFLTGFLYYAINFLSAGVPTIAGTLLLKKQRIGTEATRYLNAAITINASSINICPGGTATFSATATQAGTAPVYQWQVNGVNRGANEPTFSSNTLASGDVIRCILTTDPQPGASPITVISNVITVHVGREPDPEVTIAASATNICAGTAITFTATNKSSNYGPSYQWSVNGTPVGTNSTTYTSNTLKNGDVVQCRMTVPHCLNTGTTKDDADPITITVNPAPAPTVVITTPSPTVCRGNQARFLATATNAGANPTYQWKINDLAAGTNSASFITAAVSDGDVVSCVVTADPSGACSGTPNAMSNKITIKTTEQKVTAITIKASANNLCGNMPVMFTATVIHGGNPLTYQWLVNGIKVGSNSATYTASNLKDGDEVTCTLNTDNTPCAVTVFTTSNTIVMAVRAAPQITVHPADTTVMAGTAVQLLATVNGNAASYQWTPADQLSNAQSLTPVTVPLQQPATFSFRAIAANGCEAAGQAVIKVVNKLYIPTSFTPNGDGLNEVFRIPPGADFTLKEMAVFDRWGNKVFWTKDIGTGWNGKYKGSPLNEGAYIYTISGKTENGEVLLKGTVLLLR